MPCINAAVTWTDWIRTLNSLATILRLKFSAWQLALLVAIFITVADNHFLFLALGERLDPFSVRGGAYLVTLFVLIVGAQCVVFLAVGARYLLKPILITFVLLSAMLGYFSQNLGVVFDQEMIRNVAETVRDQNRQEALELVSLAFLQYLFLFGVLPSIVIYRTTIVRKKLLLEIASRFAVAACIVAGLAVLALPNWKYLTYFSIEHRDLRMYVTPLYALSSVAKYIREAREDRDIPFREIGSDAYQEQSGTKKVVGIVVIGETARADHFSLNGYSRRTNPLLENDGIVSFRNVSACGTSTAFSVPCMFSLRERQNFTPQTVAQESNVLDVLSYAGVYVVWIDNNSSCKGVCARIDNENLREQSGQALSVRGDKKLYDEDLLRKLDKYIQSTTSDVLIVLHTLGSHGPAYHNRYPHSFAIFDPFCAKNSPQECTDEEVINAYDNTIVYTDYVLDEAISFLDRNADQFDSFLLYASDHGESLGENGVYLHGLPYYLAPKSQLNIPMIFWTSENFSTNHRISLTDLASKADLPISHDNFSHTLLGLYNVNSKVYIRDFDIMRPDA